MNDDIKKGAMQMADGLKAEAKEAMGKVDEVKGKLDTNKDGTVDFDELKDGVFGEAKEGFDKLKALMDSGELFHPLGLTSDEAYHFLLDTAAGHLSRGRTMTR